MIRRGPRRFLEVAVLDVVDQVQTKQIGTKVNTPAARYGHRRRSWTNDDKQ